jgi:thiamine pyrophosphate-dependent acetolactate synthase large subunit-like protein
MPSLTTAEAVIDRLEAHGVRHVFGIPGTHNLPLYRCLAGSSIEHVTPRHEQGAGYAADGYARSGGPPAACFATSGPAALNLMAAAATAHSDSIPMLIVAPGMTGAVRGRDTGYLHEAPDQLGALQRVCGSAVRAAGPAEAAAAIDTAFAGFASSRPRPAYVEIPLDAFDRAGPVADKASAPADPDDPEPRSVTAAAAILAGAGRAGIVLGGGAADAGREALQLARLLGAPVVTTVNGKGVVPEHDPISLGASIRLTEAQRFLEGCDAVLAVGTGLGHSDLWRDPPLPLSGKLIRVDIDPAQRHKNARASVAITADAASALSAIAAELDGLEARDRGGGEADPLRSALRAEALRHGADYEELIGALERALGEDAIIAGDSTRACYDGVVHLLPLDRPRRFLYPTGFATLGYGIPAGIGAKLAHPDHDVVVLIGDGGAMFTLSELIVAVELGLGIAIVVVNDGGYGEIKREMIAAGQPPVGVDLATPVFAAVARAFAARGETIEGPARLPGLVSAAFAAPTPTVIDVRLQPAD